MRIVLSKRTPLFPVLIFCLLISVDFAVAKDIRATQPATPPNKTLVQPSGKPRVQPSIKPKMHIAPANAADLVIQSVGWIDHAPLPGNKVGVEGVYRITVSNNGKGIANPTVIRLTCTPVGGAPAPLKASGTLNCPQLLPGRTSQLAWPAYSTETWKEGSYRLRIELDATKMVLETNELNNTKNVQFLVRRKSIPGSSANQPPAVNPAVVTAAPKPDLIIQNVKITPPSPAVGDTIGITLTFRNIGKAKSGPVGTSYRFYRTGSDGVQHSVNGNNLINTPHILIPGEIQTYKFSTKLTSINSNLDYTIVRSGDTIDMKFEIMNNLTTSIPEEDETNNSKSLSFVIK
jgi:hypothetical protein